MNGFQKSGLVIFVILVTAMMMVSAFAEDVKPVPAAKAASNEIVERGWSKRCPEQQKGAAAQKNCEVFQRIDMKETSMRVAEFAVGFPNDKDLKKGSARGVVVLPLGILLEQGVTMKIGEGNPVIFRNRYCTNAGCFSYINLDKAMLDSMKKAKGITFNFKSAEGQNINVIMNLNGFERTLKELGKDA